MLSQGLALDFWWEGGGDGWDRKMMMLLLRLLRLQLLLLLLWRETLYTVEGVDIVTGGGLPLHHPRWLVVPINLERGG